MVVEKITRRQRIELMYLYDERKLKEAQDLAIALGVSKNYATVLVAKRDKPKKLVHSKKWKRAIANGSVIA